MKQRFTPAERRELLILLRPKLIERALRDRYLDQALERQAKKAARS